MALAVLLLLIAGCSVSDPIELREGMNHSDIDRATPCFQAGYKQARIDQQGGVLCHDGDVKVVRPLNQCRAEGGRARLSREGMMLECIK